MTPRYKLMQGEQGYLTPIDQEATEQLVREMREIMPDYDPEAILEHLVAYAALADRNLSHPSDDPSFQAAYNFMVALTNRLSKLPNGLELWSRWNLGAKGQIEVTP